MSPKVGHSVTLQVPGCDAVGVTWHYLSGGAARNTDLSLMMRNYLEETGILDPLQDHKHDSSEGINVIKNKGSRATETQTLLTEM